VGEAYGRKDLEALKLLVAADMEEDAANWLERTRPEAWKEIPPDAIVAVSVPTKPDVASAKYGMATVTVDIAISSVPGYLNNVSLYWVPRSKNSSSPDWVLDAKRTFETAGKTRLALKVPPPRKKSKADEDPG